jgi:hypothetical protein
MHCYFDRLYFDLMLVVAVNKGGDRTVRKFQNIIAWQKADDLVVEVYRITTFFPKDELYGLVSQMRKAAISVPANIVEGSARLTSKDYLHFLFPLSSIYFLNNYTQTIFLRV